MIFDDLGYAKSVIFVGSGDKLCNLAENEFGQLWDRFWPHFGCFWGAWGSLKCGKVGSRRGSKKSSIFETPFFSILADFGCPGGGQKFVNVCPFFGSFTILGAIFFDRAPFWAILMDFDGLGTIFA